jgi:predicted Zn-dependent protease with MMP-like domain
MSYDTLSELEWERIDRVWSLLEDGEIESAGRELETLARDRPGHPDVRIVEAAVSIEQGDATRALDTLKGAERSADPALFFHLRALAAYELARFEQTRDDAERALAVRPDMPEPHDLLSRTFEHLGDAARAAEHAAEARALDPEGFAEPLAVDDEEFDRLVERSLKELPAEIRRRLDEMPVLVQPLPDRAVLASEQPPLSPDLLGLFVGRHLLERTHLDVPGAPGVIVLFRRNLLRMCADRDELEREVRTTVQHEVGHLLGLDEDDLEQWGLG